MGIELTDIFITLHPRKQWTRAKTQDELVTLMNSELAGLPGMRIVFTQPIEMRLNEMIAGIRTDVGVKIFGDDLDVLRESAAKVGAVLETIPGRGGCLRGADHRPAGAARSAWTRTPSPATACRPSTCWSWWRPSAASRWARSARTSGASTWWCACPRGTATTPTWSAASWSRPPTGRASRWSAWPASSRWRGRRPSPASGSAGASSSSATCAAATWAASWRRPGERIAAEVELPPGYFTEFGGQFEHMERARLRLAIVVPVALVLILFLLYSSTQSWRDALIIFTAAPFATLGGVLALWVRGMPFTVSAGIGFVAVSGVAMLAGLVLVSTMHRLLDEGTTLDEAIEQSALMRLRPVLMTTLVAALGFVPMAVNTGVGAEVQRPLATVVIGGVLSANALTLVVLPAMYRVFGRGRRAV